MDRYYGLDTLMEFKGITSNQAFDAYYQSVLARNESQSLNLSGFDTWDIPQVDFTYKQLEIEDQLKVMATYVDLNSEPIPVGSKGIGYLEGSIPRHKARFLIGENDYRKQMIVLEQINTAGRMIGENPAGNIKNYLTELLFGGLEEIQQAHVGTLNYQVGQMKSKGKVILTDANNPRGIKNVTFDAQVPTDNYMQKNWFNAAGTPNTDDDIVADLLDIIYHLSLKYSSLEMEVNEESWLEDMKHPSWAMALGYAAYPAYKLAGENGASMAQADASSFSLERKKQLFQDIVGIPVKFDRTICGVEVWDNTAKKLVRNRVPAFDKYIYLIHPSGTLGTIKNVIPLRPDSSAISARIFGGHGIIEYRYDPKHKIQDWVSELTCLAVPNRPKDMYYLKVRPNDFSPKMIVDSPSINTDTSTTTSTSTAKTTSKQTL